MKAFQITGSDGFQSLHLAEIPNPTPGFGEVVVRIEAVSLNYRDYANVTGTRGIRGPVPRVPCSDGAGTVVALGDGVSQWSIGDRVVCPFMPTWQSGGFAAQHAGAALGGAVDGLLREQACLPAESLLPIPEGYSFSEAATFPCAAVTAWNALMVKGGLKPGETVMTLGTGGVSIFALQLAKLCGARVLTTTSSEAKANKLRELGADEVHIYSGDPNWDTWALSQTNGSGVDKVVEIGGPDTLNRSINATRFGGHIALIGVLTGLSGEIQTVQLLRKGIRLDGVYVGSKAMMAEMINAMVQGQLRPVIDSTFDLTDAAAAFRHMESGKHFGKIVVQVSASD
jgi:NADPH:quinone reductase-like Zn-dependent oxidoreductase